MESRGYFGLLIFVIAFISGCAPANPGVDYTIVDNSVVIDNDDLYLNVTPHTLSSSGWVLTEFESKNYGGDIDFAFGFNTDNAYPTQSQIYSPRDINRTREYTCYGVFNYTLTPERWFTCTDDLGSFSHWFDTGNISTATAYWHENYTKYWWDWKPDNKINYNFSDMNTWYYSKNQNINAGQRYKLRYYLEVPFNPNGSEGKYTLALKPSSETFQEAIANGHFYYLDPWWNASYHYRYDLNITISGELAQYSDPIIEVPLVGMNGSWESLEVVLDNTTTYEWEWAWHDATATNGNATKAIRFVASNVTFTNKTRNERFAIYTPLTKLSNNNDSIFLVAEDFNDGNINGWNKDANYIVAFQGDGWINVSNNDGGDNPHNMTFSSFESLDGANFYYGQKIRYTTSLMEQNSYAIIGENTLNGNLAGAIGGQNAIMTYDGTDFLGVLSADVTNISMIMNMSFTGATSIYNISARAERLINNNSRLSVTDRGSANVIRSVNHQIGGLDTVHGVYLDDIYLGRLPFQLYFANVSIQTQEQIAAGVFLSGETISPAIVTPTTDDNVGCYAAYSNAVAGKTANITFAWFKNSVIDETYNSTINLQEISTQVNATTNYTAGGLVKGDVLTCGVWAWQSDDETVTDTGNTSVTVSGTAPTTPTTATPSTGSFVSMLTTQTLSCSGSTDSDGDTIAYEFWNQSSLMQNTTSTTFTFGNFGNVSTMYNWSCRASDSDGQSDWYNKNWTVTTAQFARQNETYPVPFVNFSFKDEITLAITNASITTSQFDWTIVNDNYTYTYTNTTASNYTTFGFEPANASISVDGSITYVSTGYPTRVWGDTLTLSSTVTNKVLYLLKDTDGSYSTYNVVDVYSNPIQGVSVEVVKVIDGTSTVVASGTTDDAGSITFFLDPTTSHSFTFTKTGYTTLSTSITPALASYTITLTSSTSTNATYYGDLEGISWKIYPQQSTLATGTQYNFSFYVWAQQNNLYGCQFILKNVNNQTLANMSGCDGSNHAYANISTTYTMNVTKLFGVYYVRVDNASGSFIIVDGDTYYTNLAINDTLANASTLKHFFQGFKNLNTSSWNWGEDENEIAWSSIAFFFLATAIIFGTLSYFTNLQFTSTPVLIWTLFALIWIGSWVGAFTIDLNAVDEINLASTNISGIAPITVNANSYLEQYWLAILMFFIAAGNTAHNFVNRRGS